MCRRPTGGGDPGAGHRERNTAQDKGQFGPEAADSAQKPSKRPGCRHTWRSKVKTRPDGGCAHHPPLTGAVTRAVSASGQASAMARRAGVAQTMSPIWLCWRTIRMRAGAGPAAAPASGRAAGQTGQPGGQARLEGGSAVLQVRTPVLGTPSGALARPGRCRFRQRQPDPSRASAMPRHASPQGPCNRPVWSHLPLPGLRAW